MIRNFEAIEQLESNELLQRLMQCSIETWTGSGTVGQYVSAIQKGGRTKQREIVNAMLHLLGNVIYGERNECIPVSRYRSAIGSGEGTKPPSAGKRQELKHYSSPEEYKIGLI